MDQSLMCRETGTSIFLGNNTDISMLNIDMFLLLNIVILMENIYMLVLNIVIWMVNIVILMVNINILRSYIFLSCRYDELGEGRASASNSDQTGTLSR